MAASKDSNFEIEVIKKTQLETTTLRHMNAKYTIAIGLAAFTAGWVGSAAQEDAKDPAAPAPVITDNIMPQDSTPANGLFLNFQDVPLNTVLNYLSAKIGLIVISDVDVRVKVSVVARQAITTNDVVDLLGDQLAHYKYAAMLNGRTLTIMNASSAKTSANTKIVNNADPKRIPFNDEIVTEILPLQTLDPAKLVQNLESLIPHGDTVTASESGGAIIMTAPQKDVHRIAEIISALDSASISDVAVFVLKFADSKSVAAELKEVFQTADSEVTGNAVGAPFGGGGGGFPGGGGGGGGSAGESKNSQTHAVFVSDDQINAVVTSAPPGFMPGISNVIHQLGQPNRGITEIRVFRLKHADPGEMAEELSNLFPSNTTDSSDQNGQTMGFIFDGPPEMQQQFSAGSNQSDRMKRQTSVVVVADRRTQSIVVTASGNLMEQIKEMMEDLDASSMGVQHIQALSIGSADPTTVQEAMVGLFASASASAQSTSQTPLLARATANANNQSSVGTTLTSGTGTASGSTTGVH